MFPQSKSSAESISIVPGSAVWRQPFQFFDIASSQNYIIGFKGCDQARHYIRHITPPLFLASFFKCLTSHVVLIRALLVGKMSQFHWLQNAIHNQGRTEARAQTEEEHLASLVAPQGLHGRIIHDLNRAPECAFKIKPNPPGRQIVRVRDRPVLNNRAGVSHRHRVILPRSGQPLDAGDHLLRCHGSARRKLPRRVMPGGKNFHMSSANVNYEHLHE